MNEFQIRIKLQENLARGSGKAEKLNKTDSGATGEAKNAIKADW